MPKKSRLRIFGKRSMLFLNILVSIVLLYPLAFSPVNYIWINGFIGIITPYLLLLELFFLIFWLVVKPALIIPSLLSLILSWKLIIVIVGLHPGASFPKIKKDNSVRVISWNVRGFNGLSQKSTLKLRTEEIAYSIQKWNPDIICLQEYNTNERKGDIANHAPYFEKKYPYSFFSKDYQTKESAYYAGCIIYSKYKILHTERYPFSNKESLITATILKGDDTLQVFTTHMASYRFAQDDLEAIDDATKNKWTVLSKMKAAFKLRASQAQVVAQQINASFYPAIITGDFNDVPGSYTYRKISDGWQDAFLKKSFGIGATYMGLSPTLRIDYIFTNSHWDIKAFEQVDENLSDHHMIIADLLLKKQ
jgi:endonuclease/exonuclease/phosphatase family metal-dependent hydrolase